MQLPPPEAVVFDVYDTLVEITDRRRQLLTLLAERGRPRQSGDAALLMSQPLDLRTAVERLGHPLMADDLTQVEQDLAAELASIRLFPEVLETLKALRMQGVPVAVCSNLALPYAAPVQRLLAGLVDVEVWSFECGAIKPQPEIYYATCRALHLPPEKVLMIGDNPEADVFGPRRVGMQARLLDRTGRHRDSEALRTLDNVPALLHRH